MKEHIATCCIFYKFYQAFKTDCFQQLHFNAKTAQILLSSKKCEAYLSLVHSIKSLAPNVSQKSNESSVLKIFEFFIFKLFWGKKKKLLFLMYYIQSQPLCLYSLCKLIRFNFPFCRCFLVNYANLLFILAAF